MDAVIAVQFFEQSQCGGYAIIGKSAIFDFGFSVVFSQKRGQGNNHPEISEALKRRINMDEKSHSGKVQTQSVS